ncbi:MAG: endopeptidase La [Ruminococcaceae bacterium]|nr:endopeptidase La [Oscillospiraceae bacterium]
MILDENQIGGTFPAMALRGLVAFPNMMLTLDVGRKKSVRALQFAMDKNVPIYLVTQKDVGVEDPNKTHLYDVGCLCRVRQVLKMPDGGAKVLVKGVYRARHINFTDNGAHYVATIEKCDDKPIRNRDVYIETLIRRIRTEFERYAIVAQNLPEDIILNVEKSKNLGELCDFIAFNIPAPYDDKQYVLEQLNVVTRAKILLELLQKEREVTEIDNRIGQKTRAVIDENQRDYYLREQMKIISEELYGDDAANEIDEYHQKTELLNASDAVKEKIHTEINKLSKMPQGAHESTVSRAYIEACLSLPWNKCDNTVVDIKKAQKILDRDFYGMKKVKERILEALSVYALSPESRGNILCLYGPPGVGKTSIGKTIAECMGRKYQRISLGGMHDEAEIRGHRKTYIGAMMGKILTAFKNAGTSNPLILLDEIDKLGSDYKGDPASALLEVLDPEQNCNFTDNFLEMPYDLSRAVFITTANSLDTIPAPLLDRMEVVSLDGYTREEKFNIAKRHIIPREIVSHGLTTKICRFADSAIYSIIDFYTREAGVRKLQRCIGSLCGKAAKKIAEGSAKKVNIKASDLQTMIGHKKYRPDAILPQDEIGIINGLAWTQVGGEIMQMEVAILSGSGKTVLTGNLGDVMKESAEAAITFVRANAEKYGIDTEFYKTRDIHIHATESAVPKDGPSAGVTITTALISALTNRPVRRDIAMTGEVSIRGRVLAIGGLKEKAMAAYRGGVKRVFIPYDNIPDIDEVDEKVRENVEFVPVKYVTEIIELALLPLDDDITKSDTYFTSQNQKSATIRN